jgi:hypothetical protein
MAVGVLALMLLGIGVVGETGPIEAGPVRVSPVNAPRR